MHCLSCLFFPSSPPSVPPSPSFQFDFYFLLLIHPSLFPFLPPSLATDWTVATRSLVKINPQAEIYEDAIDFRMGPFNTYMEAVQGENVIFASTTYSSWCSPSTSTFVNPSANHLCGLLHSVRATGVVTAALGVVTFFLYCILAFNSLKGEYVAKTARASMLLHLIQAGFAFTTVALWVALDKTYLSSLKSSLGPNFADFSLPYARSFWRVVVVGVLAVIAALALHTLATKSVGAIERQATIERKRSEFEMREAAESARRQAEEELKAETLV